MATSDKEKQVCKLYQLFFKFKFFFFLDECDSGNCPVDKSKEKSFLSFQNLVTQADWFKLADCFQLITLIIQL